MAMPLASCGQTGADSFCSVARPVYISPEDKLTDATAREIYDHDTVGLKLCGWKTYGHTQ